MKPRPTRALAGSVLTALALVVACSSLAEEGESCDRANGNADCEEGLVCLSEVDIVATRSVCCPRPPAKPSSSACEPELEHHLPDPSIDASYGAGGTGTGGTGGVGGGGGTGGTPSDAAIDGDAAAGAAGQAGGAGASGAAGSGGTTDAGSDGN